MIDIRRSALVPFTPAQMFALVNDVEAYPKRFAWCVGADVTSHDENSLTARLDLRFAGMRHSFATRNTLHRPDRIEMNLVGGPLRSLRGVWTFEPRGDNGSKIELDLSFEVANRLLGSALGLGFRTLADKMVDDFCAEARRAYG
ncbi:MAG TPA: type II toxin-antitoxin system RatA family toxin [Rhodanobacteraceae bacterium]|nr:type II toxin-antitoxin system RatA family toxin [Rhodanobacteraceae bacterium]